MSVINKMLQDLEQRQQPAMAAPPKIKAPPPRAATDVRYLWGALLLVSLVILGWLWQAHVSEGPAPAQVQIQLVTTGPADSGTEPLDPRLEAADKQIQVVTTTLPRLQDFAPPELTAAAELQPAKIAMALSTEPAAMPEPQVAKPALIVKSAPPAPAVTAQATVDKMPLSIAEQQRNMRLRANASEAAGDSSAAIAIWQQLVSQQPAEPQGYLNLARLWLQQQQIVTARQVLLQARQQGVQSAEINMQLAQLAVRQGQWQQALAFLPDQFELAAEPEYFGFKATVFQQLQQYDAALTWYRRLLQLQPEQGRWSLGAALASEQLGQPWQAHQYYQQAWQHRQALSAGSHDFIQQRLKATEP